MCLDVLFNIALNMYPSGRNSTENKIRLSMKIMSPWEVSMVHMVVDPVVSHVEVENSIIIYVYGRLLSTLT